MAMRETVRSIRAYFFLAGAISLLVGLRDASQVSKLGDGFLPSSWMAVLWYSVIARLVLGTGYLVAAVRLKAELPRGALWIRRMLLAWIAALVLDAVLIAGVIGMEIGRSEVVGSVSEVGLLDQVLRDPSVLDRPVGDVLAPSLPTLGLGEPLDAAIAMLETASAALVLDAGHPVAVVSRADILRSMTADQDQRR